MQKQAGLSKNRTDMSFCVSSVCEDFNHILFWDFDNIDEYHTLKSLSHIQVFHALGDIYIIKSNHGFNAFCLDKVFLNKAYNILYYTRWNDFNHCRIGFISESWALRLSDDKKIFTHLIPTESYDMREQSKAHFDFFNKFFDYKYMRVVSPDESKDVQLESYKQHKIK